MHFLHRVCTLLIFCVGLHEAHGVILLSTGDPQKNTSTPGDNSGWQYEGRFGGFLGTPIAPFYFVTAKHISGEIGTPLIFHGETFVTTAVYPDPETDLQIWQVAADHPFTTYAPVYRSGTELGQELRVFGRGTQRGDEISFDGSLRGWAWGTGDGVERWGSNVVSAIATFDGASYLLAGFDSPGIPNEAHLSAGDSGGGVFVLENGLWSLAATNYGVDDLFTGADGSGHTIAAIFDARGYYTQTGPSTFEPITGDQPVPTSFYCTRLAARLDWIAGVTGTDLSALPPQSYADWLTAYFTPDQRADAAVADPLADPDGDSVTNLQEFAFNLDPTFPECTIMTAGTGLRGLPLVRLETMTTGESRLTVEFVRRTLASGANLTYEAQFTASLDPAVVDWQDGGTESVTPINARWERVKVTDTVSAGADTGTRFARVKVSQPTASGSGASGLPAKARRTPLHGP